MGGAFLRSIVQDKSNLFFKMLERDKTQWWDHWVFYTQTFKEIFDVYKKLLQIDPEDEKELVSSFTRPELDKLKQSWEERGGEVKLKTLKLLTAEDVELKLEKSWFVVYFMGGLGLETVSELLVGEGHVFFTDLLAFYRQEKLEQIPEIVLKRLEK